MATGIKNNSLVACTLALPPSLDPVHLTNLQKHLFKTNPDAVNVAVEDYLWADPKNRNGESLSPEGMAKRMELSQQLLDDNILLSNDVMERHQFISTCRLLHNHFRRYLHLLPNAIIEKQAPTVKFDILSFIQLAEKKASRLQFDVLAFNQLMEGSTPETREFCKSFLDGFYKDPAFSWVREKYDFDFLIWFAQKMQSTEIPFRPFEIPNDQDSSLCSFSFGKAVTIWQTLVQSQSEGEFYSFEHLRPLLKRFHSSLESRFFETLSMLSPKNARSVYIPHTLSLLEKFSDNQLYTLLQGFHQVLDKEKISLEDVRQWLAFSKFPEGLITQQAKDLHDKLQRGQSLPEKAQILSDHFVIGRPIKNSLDPYQCTQDPLQELFLKLQWRCYQIKKEYPSLPVGVDPQTITLIMETYGKVDSIKFIGGVEGSYQLDILKFITDYVLKWGAAPQIELLKHLESKELPLWGDGWVSDTTILLAPTFENWLAFGPSLENSFSVETFKEVFVFCRCDLERYSENLQRGVKDPEWLKSFKLVVNYYRSHKNDFPGIEEMWNWDGHFGTYGDGLFRKLADFLAKPIPSYQDTEKFIENIDQSNKNWAKKIQLAENQNTNH